MLLHSNILGEGRPMIILHGFLGMSDNWKTLGKRFSTKDYEVHLVDQRNHGRSFHDPEFNYEILVEDLKHYCDHYKLRDIILIGHSMGGKTAMFFAVEYSYLVTKLIIADIAPRFYPVHHTEILNGLSNLDFEKIRSRKEADEQLSNFISDVGIRLFLLKNLYWVEKEKLGLRINLSVLNEQVDEIGEAFPIYYKYEGDTLFLRGDRSEYISNHDEVLIKSQFPHAVVKTISNSGHWLHAENPKEFFNAVIDFVQ